MSMCVLKERKAWCLIVSLVLLLPVTGFSQEGARISKFKVQDWFRAVKLTWKAEAPEGSEGLFEIYRSDKRPGPYVLVKEIRVGDKKFIDVIKKIYVFYDKKTKIGRKYHYKLTLRGTDQVFGPFQGIASGSPPGT
jgi:hypothetical protein